jgi:hypothetical protein
MKCGGTVTVLVSLGCDCFDCHSIKVKGKVSLVHGLDASGSVSRDGASCFVQEPERSIYDSGKATGYTTAESLLLLTSMTSCSAEGQVCLVSLSSSGNPILLRYTLIL